MEQGLTHEQAAKLQEQFGKNTIVTTQHFSALKLFLSQFPTLINGILCLAAVFSFFIHEALDGFFILLILVLNACLGFYQEFKAEKALQKLQAFTSPRCIVVRSGKAQEINTSELVPGDTILINEGDRIGADGKITRSTNIEMDESLLTGESLPVERDTGDTLSLGTYVAKGKGVMVVEKIGKDTRLGQISQTLSNVTDEQTPLEKQIIKLSRQLSFVALGIGLLMVPIGVMYHMAIYPLLLLVISICVAAIPESLPVVITIALALGTNRMAQKHAIVRRLASIETIGAINVILTDKTGTLTQNDMRVKEIWTKKKSDIHDLSHACLVGNTAHIISENQETTIIGDKTDGALLLWAQEQQDGSEEPIEVHDEFTFDPQTKSITVVASIHNKTVVIVRGAPESILSMCKMTPKEKGELTKRYEAYAKQGLRVIAVAQKGMKKHVKQTRQQLEQHLTFLGFLCLYDPPREEAREAVLSAQEKGISVIMVTGDNPITAGTIAEEVGITHEDTRVITGAMLDIFTDEQLQETIMHTHVYARTTPEHKLRLVQAFQKSGFLVGVTGDGVNDALALKQADVGLSMGQKGTDVAREASDIVLADDNFATIVAAVSEGRKIYANVVKSIMYLVSGNLAELLLVFFATASNMVMPLLPTQILWINLVTDGLPALALANDPSIVSTMRSIPRSLHESLITTQRGIRIGFYGLTIALFCFVCFFLTYQTMGVLVARTVTFNLLIVSELVLALMVRGKQKLATNLFLFITIAITLFLQVLISTIPLFQTIFHIGL